MKKAIAMLLLTLTCITAFSGSVEARQRQRTNTTVIYQNTPPPRYYVEERVIVPQERIIVPQERVYVQERRYVPQERVYVEQRPDVVVVERRDSCPGSFWGGAFMGFVVGALTH